MEVYLKNNCLLRYKPCLSGIEPGTSSGIVVNQEMADCSVEGSMRPGSEVGFSYAGLPVEKP